MRSTVHKVRVLVVGALLAVGLAVALTAVPTGAMPSCGPGESWDKDFCVRVASNTWLIHQIRAGTTSTTTTTTTTTTTPVMTSAVALHAPPQEWIDGTTTSQWTCTQVLIDFYEDELSATAPCMLDDEVTTITENTFATPSGCVVIVTVAKNGKGHGSTSCLTDDQVDGYETVIKAEHSDEQDIAVADLPDCPDSTDPAVMNALPADASGRKRCVARN